MNIQPTNQQPISDDQELAKVLAGVSQQADEAAAIAPADADEAAAEEVLAASIAATPPAAAAPTEPEPIVPPSSPVAPVVAPAMPIEDLSTIKQDALNELRPLVDKLNVQPEEKFDTYLLLLRSTDDKTLIGPAHDAARSIPDEARRAQALLDIIKEIDYLAGPQQPTA